MWSGLITLTASDLIAGYLVTLDEVLLGMSFLRHFELSQRGQSLTLRAAASP